jgi:peptide/nickel transport system substrate-binding protein
MKNLFGKFELERELKRRDFLKYLGVGGTALFTSMYGSRQVFGSKNSGNITLRTVCNGDPVIFGDPARTSYSNDRYIALQIFEGAFQYDYRDKPPFLPHKRLAKDYKIAKDNLSMTIELHKGVQFHHGYGELTAEDLAYTLRRHLDPKTASRARSRLKYIDKVDILDKYTVKLSLNKPTAFAIWRLMGWQTDGYIMCKKATENLPKEEIGRKPVGTGPYYFYRYEPGKAVVLKRFEDYWGGPKDLGIGTPQIDTIEMPIVKDLAVAIDALRTGELDIVPMLGRKSYIKGKALPKDKFSIITANAAVAKQWIAPNPKVKPMDDLRVRKALAYALDDKLICDRLGELATAFASPIPSAVFGATKKFWTYEYNLDKAKQLLKEAGYPDGFELQFCWYPVQWNEPFVREVKNQWDKIVDVKLKTIERAVFFSKASKGELWHVSTSVMSRLDPAIYADMYTCGASRNYFQYCNPELDKIVEKALTATDIESSQQWYYEIQRIISEDVVGYYPGETLGGIVMANYMKNPVVSPYPGSAEIAFFRKEK